ncbi:hypothetical protein CA11_05840 [Gimesia maris]|uniref:hypothetical protein n=1 Tax=Gimesia maris TaxID=122 RepID=UPI00118A2776|nr:hypothetical protein [Gimesia maris]QDU12804.1 hypothetical protein CA11_05840 [Gimesia maris]
MSISTTETLSVEIPDRPSLWNTSNLALGSLLLLVVTATPQLVCMPVTNDVSYYDLQTRTVMRGGVLYRDIVEPNFPGVVWVHLTIRGMFGWSTEVLRVCDLILFGLTVTFLARFVSPVRFQLSFLLFLAYFLFQNGVTSNAISGSCYRPPWRSICVGLKSGAVLRRTPLLK